MIGKMENIELKNKEFLDDLSKFQRFATPEFYEHLECLNKEYLTKEKREHFTGVPYLKNLLSHKEKHDGYPERFVGYNLKVLREKTGEVSDKTVKINTEIWNEIDSLSTKYCFKHTALFALYPPGGYISWHNNANASAYNMIFTWSETGDGSFTYLDREKSKLIVMEDVSGWQAKMGFFGSYHDAPKSLIYHTAKTNCWRMTISFVFDRSPASKELQQWIATDVEYN